MRLSIILLLQLFFAYAYAHTPLKTAPEVVGLNPLKLALVDKKIENAIYAKQIPGAVLTIVRHGKIAYLKSYGNKQTFPKRIAMTDDTEFDMASCTKPLATAIASMILYEKGIIKLNDKVVKYIPEFAHKDVQLIHLLTHTSGLPSYISEGYIKRKYGNSNPAGLMQAIDSCKTFAKPGTLMQYSCLNYITLQHIIEKVSMQSLRDFTKQNIYNQLGMYHTDFNPDTNLKKLCAPTSKINNGKEVLIGIVHDPLARNFNLGISGNAGLFSNANDLAIITAALQNGGEWNGQRILKPETVLLMRTVPDSLKRFGRTPGWDINSTYSSCKGHLLSKNSYCHTGYTGTSIVIDPDNDISVILLTNRVHPIDKGSVVKLRADVADAVASAIIK